jgi:hypothetical protein
LASQSGGSSLVTAVIVILIIIVVVARRVYRNYIGVKVTPSRTIGYTLFYFAFGAFFVSASFFEGVQLIYALPDLLVLFLGVIISHRVSDMRISFWKTSDGSIFYKGFISFTSLDW